MPQKGTEKRRSSENVISTDTSALLWIYCREIAPFETPIFSKNVGELIARATSVPQKRTDRGGGCDQRIEARILAIGARTQR
jgi:hypothetical protein